MKGLFGNFLGTDVYVFETEEEMDATEFEKDNSIIIIGRHAIAKSVIDKLTR